jgi:hypothetical protein
MQGFQMQGSLKLVGRSYQRPEIQEQGTAGLPWAPYGKPDLEIARRQPLLGVHRHVRDGEEICVFNLSFSSFPRTFDALYNSADYPLSAKRLSSRHRPNYCEFTKGTHALSLLDPKSSSPCLNRGPPRFRATLPCSSGSRHRPGLRLRSPAEKYPRRHAGPSPADACPQPHPR